jgi:hypothetical protein
MKRSLCLIILVASLIISTLPANAQPVNAQASASSPLQAMLKLVPDSPDTHNFTLSPSYVDYNAILAAAGVKKPISSAALLAMSRDEQDLFYRALMRVTAGSGANYLRQYLTDMPQLVGFDWFDVNQDMTVGAPPKILKIYGANYDPAKVGAALSARGFEKQEIQGVTVWSHGEDNAISLKDREPGDPFGGELGLAARIALFPGYIANTRAWPLMNDVISAYKGGRKSLADAPDYRTMVDAIMAQKGQLLQAMFISPNDMNALPEMPIGTPKAPRVDLSSYKDLPAYTMAAFTDHQDGELQVHTIAALYSDEKTATQAADELRNRLAGFDPGKIYTIREVTVDKASVYKDDSTRMAAAIVSLRYPTPQEPRSGELPVQPGLLLHIWVRALVQREFYPLMMAIPKQ